MKIIKDITLTNVPDDLMKQIDEERKKLGLSKNQYVKKILEDEMLSAESKALNEKLLKYLVMSKEIIEENTKIIEGQKKLIESLKKELSKWEKKKGD